MEKFEKGDRVVLIDNYYYFKSYGSTGTIVDTGNGEYHYVKWDEAIVGTFLDRSHISSISSGMITLHTEKKKNESTVTEYMEQITTILENVRIDTDNGYLSIISNEDKCGMLFVKHKEYSPHAVIQLDEHDCMNAIVYGQNVKIEDFDIFTSGHVDLKIGDLVIDMDYSCSPGIDDLVYITYTGNTYMQTAYISTYPQIDMNPTCHFKDYKYIIIRRK